MATKRAWGLLLVFMVFPLLGPGPRPALAAREGGEVRAQLAESLPLIGVNRVRRELGVTGVGVGVLVVDDWTPREDGRRHGQAVVEILRATAPGADLWTCRLDLSRPDAEGAVASCLSEAVRQGLPIQIVNLSFAVGDRTFARPCELDTPLARTIRRLAGAAGVIFVAAAGNGGLDGALRFPACLPEVISVGASYDLSGPVTFDTGQSECRDVAVPDRIACYSNVAPYLDVVAPGSVVSTPSAPDFGGTSAAAPLVSGTIALMLSVDPGLDRPEIVDLLRETAASAVDPRSQRTFPRIDAYRAAQRVLDALTRPALTDYTLRRLDADGDGRLDDAEFVSAVADWVTERLSDELFFIAIELWVAQGRPDTGARASVSPSALHAEPPFARVLREARTVRLYDLRGRLAGELHGGSPAAWRALADELPNGVYVYVAAVPGAHAPLLGKISVVNGH